MSDLGPAFMLRWQAAQRRLSRSSACWVSAWVGAVMGVGLVLLLASEVWQAHDQARQALALAESTWQAQGQAKPSLCRSCLTLRRTVRDHFGGVCPAKCPPTWRRI